MFLLCRAAINDMYTNNGKGNAELANLPRKLNIALSPSRDDFPHTHINDVGLVAVKHPDTGEVHIWKCCRFDI
jgi:ferredoxin-nitrite reductase